MNDIVDRLRAAAKSGDLALGQSFDCLAVAEEIERLRAAGDALHAWITINATSAQQESHDYNQVLDAWEEARRG